MRETVHGYHSIHAATTDEAKLTISLIHNAKHLLHTNPRSARHAVLAAINIDMQTCVYSHTLKHILKSLYGGHDEWL